MLSFEIGKTYLVEMPRWYFLGRVAAVSPLAVAFEAGGAQVHWIGDLPTLLASGKLSTEDEVSPVAVPSQIPMLWMGQVYDWPHAMPTARTHGALETRKK